MPSSFNLLGFLFVMAGWIFSVCLHEFAHALVAWHGGDESVAHKGYLTFNPLRYTNKVSSLLLPLLFLFMGGIALPGGAVYINRSRLRSRGWDCAVSLAGPAANALLLAFLMAPFWLGLAPRRTEFVIWPAYAFVCRLQISAILFNLIPVPPLDGFGAVSAYMEPAARARIYALGNYLFMGLLIALVQTPLGAGFWQFQDAASDALGIPAELALEGYGMMRF